MINKHLTLNSIKGLNEKFYTHTEHKKKVIPSEHLHLTLNFAIIRMIL